MITDSFDPTERPIITLQDIYGEQQHLADVCIVTFSDVICKEILSAHACERITQIRACNGDMPIYAFSRAGRTIAFYVSPIGSTAASQCVLEANWLTGATKFVMFGSAGSLAYEQTANRFVVPTHAYRDEGMSYHYAPPADYIAVKNSEIVRSLLEELRVPCVPGRTWTTDAILRETAEQMAKRKAEGCIAVEMEIAGVQAVCDFSGLQLYTFLMTGDVLSEDGYSLGTIAQANHSVNAFRVAEEIALRV